MRTTCIGSVYVSDVHGVEWSAELWTERRYLATPDGVNLLDGVDLSDSCLDLAMLTPYLVSIVIIFG